MPSSGRRAPIVRLATGAAPASDLRVRDEVSVCLTLVSTTLRDIPSEINTPNNNKKPIPTDIKSMSTPSVTVLRRLRHVQGVELERLFP